MSTNVYIDGFNLYRGCLKDARSCRWLDLASVARRLVPKGTVQDVKFFTAKVKGNRESARRQDLYLRALRATGVTVDDTGTFMDHIVIRPLAGAPNPRDGMQSVLERFDRTTGTWIALPHPYPRDWVRASVVDIEEKGTDVNLAAALMWDALNGQMTEAVVISGDSDLTTPIHMIAANVVPVHVVNPTANNPSRELQQAATLYTTFPLGLLLLCQLPDPVMDGARALRKPARWS